MVGWKKTYKNRSRLRKRRRYIASTNSVVRSRRFVLFTKYAFVGVIVGFLALFIILPLFTFNLPSPDEVMRRDGFATKILDRNGNVLYDIYIDERRTPVKLEELPDSLKKATVAIEDKNFYKHQGFDPFGMLRGFSRLFTQGKAQGGSTLTQQLVKNALLTSERSVLRKVKEFVLAIQIERNFSKDEILTMYLNEVPYGGTAWGVESASQVYFGKPAKDLTLVESAILAGLPQRPSAYSPYSSTPDAYIARTEAVLRRMEEDGYISKEEQEDAVSKLPDVEFQERGASFKAPHFVQYVQSVLEETYGPNILEQGGFTVTTSLDLELHDEAQKVVAEEIANAESLGIGNGAAVVLDPDTGEILAMVGSKDFLADDYDGQVNVVLSQRQPGSAIKPVTYVTALEKGYTPSSLIMDVPTEFPGGVGQENYSPENYDGKYRGPMQLRYALANSINVTAVKMVALVGIQNMLEMAYNMGIDSLEPTNELMKRVGLSVTLGGGEVTLLELTGAYGAFMNGGFKVEPIAVLKVEDENGKVLEENEPKKGSRVISEESAYLMADILSDNNARSQVFGTNSLLNIPGRQTAVKTGTTNDKRDNWAIGGNPQFVVGVWVGNNDNSPMKQVASGVSGATPIWRRIILSAYNGEPVVGFETPGNIVTAAIDLVSGYAAHDGFPSRTEKFAKGTEPGEDPIHVKLKVCKNDGKIATPGDIASGNYEEKEYFIFKEDDPLSTAGSENLWQKGILEWISTQNNPLYKPPTENCGSGSPIGITFRNPEDQTSNHPNELEIRLSADSTSGIKEIVLYVDGEKERTFTGPPFTHSINLDNGTYELRAVAKDNNGNEADRTVRIGVGMGWNDSPSPTPTLIIPTLPL